MKNKLVRILVCILLILIIMPITVSENELKEENVKISLISSMGRAWIASIYLELEPDSLQAKIVQDNFHQKPNGILTNIDITVTEPNQDYYLFIGPFFKTFIRQILYNDSQSRMVFPDESVTLYIPLFFGDVREWEPVSGRPARLIVDGWAILLSWKY